MDGDRLVTRDGQRLPLDAEVADGDLIWIANEGVRTSALVASLRDQRPARPDEQRILERLLATTTDPLRFVAEQSPLVPGPPGAGSGTTEGEPMARNTFTFTGPVTINVSGWPGAGLTADAAAQAVAGAPGLVVDGLFREKKLKFDENYKARERRGYKPGFLAGWNLSAPTVDPARHHGALVLTAAGAPWVIPYYHYSLVMNRDRRLLAWAASNVDYSPAARAHTRTRKQYGGEDWRLDPRVALEEPGLQIEDADFYAPARKIDRGHIVRREDSAWGATSREAEFGNSDTYHWTNCTPQSEAFNQASERGIWGKFEEFIEKQIKAEGGRMCVFAGPVLQPDDPRHGYGAGTEIQVPMEFWKVIACTVREGGRTRKLAYGFVFDQTEPVQRLGFERIDVQDYAIYQMPIREISRKTGVVFEPSVLTADVLEPGGANESIRGFAGTRITALDSVILG
jgi:endonuclease G